MIKEFDVNAVRPPNSTSITKLKGYPAGITTAEKKELKIHQIFIKY